MPTSFIMWFELGSCCLRCWSHAMQQSCCLNESFRIQPRHSRILMSWLASCLVRMESEWTPKKMWKSPCCGTEPSTEGEGTLICMAFPLPLHTKLPGALHRKASEMMDGWMQGFCAHQKPFWPLHSCSLSPALARSTCCCPSQSMGSEPDRGVQGDGAQLCFPLWEGG